MKKIYTTEPKLEFCKPHVKKNLKEWKSNFCYWVQLDDFGDVLKYLPWHTDKNVIKSLGNRVAEVRRCYDKLEFEEECLF